MRCVSLFMTRATRTGSTPPESLFEFLDVWQVEEKALDHQPKILIFDACPTWATAMTFSPKVAARYGCKVIIADGGDHNTLPKMEAAQDPLTRMAEAMIKRRGWSKGFFLHARACGSDTEPQGGQPPDAHENPPAHTGKPSSRRTSLSPSSARCAQSSRMD